MPQILNKTAVSFDEFTVNREKQEDGSFKYFIGLGYIVLTAEGEAFTRTRSVELTGAQATQAATMFTNITNRIKTAEGLS